MASTYATTAQLKARFADDATVAHLTDDTETGTPDDTVLQGVIDRAEGLINSFAARKYAIPMAVTDVPFAAFMQELTLDLAVWYLVGGRGDIVSVAKEKAYDDAVLWLERLAKGEVEPPMSQTPDATETRDPQFSYGVGSDLSGSQRTFTRESQRAL